MIEFNYIIGANIELSVTAKLTPDEPEVNFEGGAEIISVTLPDGTEVETDEIYIQGPSLCRPIPLNDLLEVAAMEEK